MKSSLRLCLLVLLTFCSPLHASQKDDEEIWKQIQEASERAAKEQEADSADEALSEEKYAAERENRGAEYERKYASYKVKPNKTAIIFLHALWGKPSFQGGGPISDEGFHIFTPSMPWAAGRNLDQTYEVALQGLEKLVQTLRKDGFQKIFIGGHSFGANAALAYAASYNNIDGIILLAPGFNPDIDRNGQFRQVALAKELVAAGKGSTAVTFTEYNSGNRSRASEASAEIFTSYFDPSGKSNMSLSAKSLRLAIPVLAIMSSTDFITSKGPQYFFNHLPAHPRSEYKVSQAPHDTLPISEIQMVLNWVLACLR